MLIQNTASSMTVLKNPDYSLLINPFISTVKYEVGTQKIEKINR